MIKKDDLAVSTSVKNDANNQTGLGRFLSNSFGSLWNKLTGAGYTQAQIEQQNYQTDMANTAFQRQVKDMQAAGLNPALLYGSGAGSGAATPSGSEVSGNGSIGDAVQLALVSKQMKLLDAQAEQALSNAELTSRDAAWRDRLNQATLDRTASEIGLNESTINAREYDNALKAAQTALTKTQNRWFGKTAQAQIQSWNAQAAHQAAEAAISQMEKELGHRLSSSELLAITDSLLSLIAGSNPLSTRAGRAVTAVVKKAAAPKGYKTSTAAEAAGLGGRAASVPARRNHSGLPGQRRTRYGSAPAGGR